MVTELIMGLVLSAIVNTSVPVDTGSINSISNITDFKPIVSEQVDITEISLVIDNTSSEVPLNDDTVSKQEVIEFKTDSMTLYEGKAGEEVLRLKKYLNEKGYNIVVSSYFDADTTKIVKEYQKSNGLVVDGYVGKGTYTHINKDMQSQGLVIPYLTISFEEKVPDKTWLIINKTSNMLYHMNGANIIDRYSVATGKTPSSTPEGKFTIVVKYLNPYWGGAGKYKPIKGGASNNPLGKRWMGLSIKGGGTYGIHGNAAPKSIGTFASMGCIRMNNNEVEYIYELIPTGTPVWIGTETKLKEFGVHFSNNLLTNGTN